MVRPPETPCIVTNQAGRAEVPEEYAAEVLPHLWETSGNDGGYYIHKASSERFQRQRPFADIYDALNSVVREMGIVHGSKAQDALELDDPANESAEDLRRDLGVATRLTAVGAIFVALSESPDGLFLPAFQMHQSAAVNQHAHLTLSIYKTLVSYPSYALEQVANARLLVRAPERAPILSPEAAATGGALLPLPADINSSNESSTAPRSDNAIDFTRLVPHTWASPKDAKDYLANTVRPAHIYGRIVEGWRDVPYLYSMLLEVDIDDYAEWINENPENKDVVIDDIEKTQFHLTNVAVLATLCCKPWVSPETIEVALNKWWNSFEAAAAHTYGDDSNEWVEMLMERKAFVPFFIAMAMAAADGKPPAAIAKTRRAFKAFIASIPADTCSDDEEVKQPNLDVCQAPQTEVEMQSQPVVTAAGTKRARSEPTTNVPAVLLAEADRGEHHPREKGAPLSTNQQDVVVPPATITSTPAQTSSTSAASDVSPTTATAEAAAAAGPVSTQCAGCNRSFKGARGLAAHHGHSPECVQVLVTNKAADKKKANTKPPSSTTDSRTAATTSTTTKPPTVTEPSSQQQQPAAKKYASPFKNAVVQCFAAALPPSTAANGGTTTAPPVELPLQVVLEMMPQTADSTTPTSYDRLSLIRKIGSLSADRFKRQQPYASTCFALGRYFTIGWADEEWESAVTALHSHLEDNMDLLRGTDTDDYDSGGWTCNYGEDERDRTKRRNYRQSRRDAKAAFRKDLHASAQLTALVAIFVALSERPDGRFVEAYTAYLSEMDKLREKDLNVRDLRDYFTSSQFCASQLRSARLSSRPATPLRALPAGKGAKGFGLDTPIDFWRLVPHTWVSPSDAIAYLSQIRSKCEAQIADGWRDPPYFYTLVAQYNISKIEEHDDCLYGEDNPYMHLVDVAVLTTLCQKPWADAAAIDKALHKWWAAADRAGSLLRKFEYEGGDEYGDDAQYVLSKTPSFVALLVKYAGYAANGKRLPRPSATGSPYNLLPAGKPT